MVAIDARLFYDNGTAIRDSTTAVIRDAETLAKFWTDATKTQSSPPQPPTVSFDKSMLLLVAGGRMPQENEIRIDSAGERTEKTADGKNRNILLVHYTVTEGCHRSNRDGYPVEIVRVGKYSGEVRFRRERVTVPCR